MGERVAKSRGLDGSPWAWQATYLSREASLTWGAYPASRVEAALGTGAQAIDEAGKIDAMAPLAIGSWIRWTGRLPPPVSPALVRL